MVDLGTKLEDVSGKCFAVVQETILGQKFFSNKEDRKIKNPIFHKNVTNVDCADRDAGRASFTLIRCSLRMNFIVNKSLLGWRKRRLRWTSGLKGFPCFWIWSKTTALGQCYLQRTDCSSSSVLTPNPQTGCNNEEYRPYEPSSYCIIACEPKQDKMYSCAGLHKYIYYDENE